MAKILVADDNSNIQKMVGLALKDQGIDVVAVGNGEAAVRKISDVHPDLVLADVFMPVRNGYEVCRYVKEDSALSHIPVILLVGAFDPLDEQEAQRVGADGVLKKPFVPPDPLISMVKSALQRAGVSLGPAAPAEKPAAPSRTAAEILGGGVAAKLPAPMAERLPEIPLEPIEEFPAPPPQVKIPEGSGPLAFGNLLNSTETEEEPPVFSSKPMINIASEKNEWDEPADVPEEEDEEETGQQGWRSGALEEDTERAAEEPAAVQDWRDEAFHGNSPAKNHPTQHWTPTTEKTAIEEVVEARAVAISTMEQKPGSPAPFASDAWAAAMAAGVEDKLAEKAEPSAKVTPAQDATPTVESSPTVSPDVAAAALDSLAAAPAGVPEKASEPAPWAAVPESTWEAEAKRAAMLASTWDAAATRSPDETQDIPAYVAEQAAAELPAAVEEPAASSAYSSHFEHETEVSAHAEAAPAEAVEQPAVSEKEGTKDWVSRWEPAPPSFATPETVAEVQPPMESPAAPEPEPVQEVLWTPPSQNDFVAAGPTRHVAVAPVPANPPSKAEEAAATAPDMDELVARVLGKMNPEVLQRVTHEILKPVIEAIVRDELESKRK